MAVRKNATKAAEGKRKKGRPKGATDGAPRKLRSLSDLPSECRRLFRMRFGRDFVPADKERLLEELGASDPMEWRRGLAYWSEFQGGSLDDRPLSDVDLAVLGVLCGMVRTPPALRGERAPAILDHERSAISKHTRRFRDWRLALDQATPLAPIIADEIEGVRARLGDLKRAGVAPKGERSTLANFVRALDRAMAAHAISKLPPE